MPPDPLPPLLGAATGVGSLPGTDVREAVRLVLGELPDLPHLPELPARGPGGESTGRAVALLVDLPAEWGPSGWRLTARTGRDQRRARALLAEDLDALEELASGLAGPLKLQVCGPLTLAATVELAHGERALADHGARRDLTESLAEGVREHLAEVARRLPRAELLLQVDEPALPAALSAGVPTASGFRTLRAVQPAEARGLLQHVVAAAVGAVPLVHCCADEPPVELLVQAGFRGLSVPASVLDPDLDDTLGAALEGGVRVLLGSVPAVAPGPPQGDDPAGPSIEEAATPARELWRRLGLPLHTLGQVVVTPQCGLAGATPPWMRSVLACCRQAARRLAEDPEGVAGRG